MLNLKTFHHELVQICPDFLHQKFLLAVSGGADSMVLLQLFRAANLQFEVAHVNYNLRGVDSSADQDLVETVCKKNLIPFHLYTVSEKDNKPKNSIQEWARNVRYVFFNSIKKDRNLPYTVTAHHLNDQLETFLINLSKASGINGVSGIPANENQILRPLLNFSKEAIYDFAKSNTVKFREDLSNKKNDYLRNQIRNEVVPKLLDMNDHFLQNFEKSISYLNQTKDFVAQQLLKIEKETITKKDSYFMVSKEKLFELSDFEQFEILKKFGFGSMEEIAKMKKAEVGRKFISSEFELVIDRAFLIITELENSKIERNETILAISDQHTIMIPQTIQAEILSLGALDWKIDPTKIQFPLRVRLKKEGDVFYPTGMVGKKKISKFFKDEKISILVQQQIWILCDAKDEILGVLPFRQDRRFIVKNESSFLHLSLSSDF
jgi:tRNA(Ile)-lysidine synthase